MRFALLLGCGVAAIASAQAASAMPWPGLTNPMAIEPVRTVCDQWGRCWEQPDYGYWPRYGYDDPYGEGGYRRPPTKWERKGFCPPGQAKKGNC